MYEHEKDYWKDFARDARRLGSPLYGQLADAIDGDEDLKAMAFARRRKQGQPPANLLLAAVHYLLLRGAEHPLRDFYPTVGGKRSGAELFAVFRDFVARHSDEIRHLIEARVTNTNEVGRSSVLRAGFGALASEEPAPLHLIEIGPSAGLNMIWDRYGICYRRNGVAVDEVLPAAPLVLSCDLKGYCAPPVRMTMPVIAGRVGLELNPVDLANPGRRPRLAARPGLAGPAAAAGPVGGRHRDVPGESGRDSRRGCAGVAAASTGRNSTKRRALCLSHHRGLSVQRRNESGAGSPAGDGGIVPAALAPVL